MVQGVSYGRVIDREFFGAVYLGSGCFRLVDDGSLAFVRRINRPLFPLLEGTVYRLLREATRNGAQFYVYGTVTA